VDASASTVLDVGCGSAKHEGAFGIDIRTDSQADLVHDLRVVPWPPPTDQYRTAHALQEVIKSGGSLADAGAKEDAWHRFATDSPTTT
jgi:hypothetical protein